MSDRGWNLVLPWKGKPKPRPKFDSRNKRAYMDSEYVKWKEDIAELVAVSNLPALQGPLSMVVTFYKDRVNVMMAEGAAPRHGQGDIDNLLGGVMDALQDAGCYNNDIQIARVVVEIIKEDT